MRRSRQICWLLAPALSLVVTAVTTASAQTKEDKAEQLFREGRDALNRGDYAAACPKFAESVRLTKRPGPLLNLAQCEEHEGKLRSALKLWREGSALLPAGDGRIALATEHVSALQPKIPRLTVKLSPEAPAGSKVTLDGIELSGAALGAPQELERGGDHVIVTTAPGHTEARSTITLVEGEHREITMVPGPAQALAPKAGSEKAPLVTPAPPPKRSARWTAGFVVGGVGLASLAAGAATGILTIQKNGIVKPLCEPTPKAGCSSQPTQDAATAGKMFSLISTITFAVGGAGLGAGIVLIATSSSKGPPASTTVAATALPGGAGFTVQGGF